MAYRIFVKSFNYIELGKKGFFMLFMAGIGYLFLVCSASVGSDGLHECIFTKRSETWEALMFRCLLIMLISALLLQGNSVELPCLSLPFEDSMQAMEENEKKRPPLESVNVRSVDGLHGRAVRLCADGALIPRLVYSTEGVISPVSGTISMWVRPLWNGGDGERGGAEALPWRHLVQMGKEASSIWLYEHFLRVDMREDKGGKKSLGMSCRKAWMNGEWHHVAVTWEKDGWSRLFVDGLPYNSGMGGCPFPSIARGLALEGGEWMALGSTRDGQNVADADFDDVAIWRRALSPEEIEGIYRSVARIDVICERRWIAAGSPAVLEIEIMPGGTLPMLSSGEGVRDSIDIEAGFSLESMDSANRSSVVIRGDAAMRVDGRIPIRLNISALPIGSYVLHMDWLDCGLGVRQRRSWEVIVYTPQKANVELGDIVRGESIEIDCVTRIPDAGSETRVRDVSGIGGIRETLGKSRDERIAYEVEIPADGQGGGPWEVSFVWPDDKPRTMGMYIYVGTEGTAMRHHRDRLEGGVMGGGEFPESGGCVTTKYLFFPWNKKYLIEVRSLISDQSAAVKMIRLQRVVGRLPRLEVFGDGRHFGHFDEDQSWEIPLAFDAPRGQARKQRMVDMLMDYMDYTGMDVLNYAAIRYSVALYDLPGMRANGGGFYETPGFQSLLLDRAASRGKRVIVSVNMNGLPEVTDRPDLVDERKKQGFFMLDRSGNPAKAWDGTLLGTPLHPEFRRRFRSQVGEVIRRYGPHPACLGIDLLGSGWALRPLSYGYDTITTAEFFREVGVSDFPVGDSALACAARADIVLRSHRQQWVRWCAKINTETVVWISRELELVNQRSLLRVGLDGELMQGSAEAASSDSLDVYGELLSRGIDINSLRAIHNVVLTPVRQVTRGRWQQHWNRQLTTGCEILSDVIKQGVLATPGRSASYSFFRYFESFKKSPMDDKYACYFQDADVKPHGRFFLRELIESLISYDSQEILVGGQTLGVSGRELEAREFARAFRVIPRRAFADVRGGGDPISVRSGLDEGGKRWMYLANGWHGLASAEFELPPGASVAMRVNGVVDEKLNKVKVRLKPFELVVLRIEGSAGEPTSLRLGVDEGDVAAQRRALNDYSDRIRELEGFSAPVASHRLLEERIVREIALGHPREAQRLLTTKRVMQAGRELGDARNGYLAERERMIRSGRYCVNCGSSRFNRVRNGVLFFPDIPWRNGESGYGFDGPHEAAEHSVDRLVSDVDRSLVFSEAYGVLAYRFLVPPGRYSVRLYNRIGFTPNAEIGRMVMNVTIEGVSVWNNLDLYEALGRDERRVLVSEFNGISCVDGVLDMEWRRPDGGGGWINAIEVFPEGEK